MVYGWNKERTPARAESPAVLTTAMRSPQEASINPFERVEGLVDGEESDVQRTG